MSDPLLPMVSMGWVSKQEASEVAVAEVGWAVPHCQLPLPLPPVITWATQREVEAAVVAMRSLERPLPSLSLPPMVLTWMTQRAAELEKNIHSAAATFCLEH